jgi:hypothetical protein
MARPDAVARWDIALEQCRPTGKPSSDIILDGTKKPSREWLGRWRDGQHAWLSSCPTGPLAGTGELDMMCPRDHIEVLRQFLAKSRHHLIIGTSGLDDHIVGPSDLQTATRRLVEADGHIPGHSATAALDERPVTIENA